MTRPHRILAVDDGPENLLLLEDLLGTEYEVLLASSGAEALDIARTLGPDLVLLDIEMPGLDGYATCREFRADPALRTAKVILVSGRAMTAERLDGYAAGADDYVTKPFEREELLAKVRVFLRLKHVEEVARMKDDLVTLIGHETRTPLAVVIGALELLAGRLAADDASARELHVTASECAARLHRLLETSALLGALRGGRRQIDGVPLQVRELLLPAWSEAQSRAERAGVAVRIDDPVPLVVVGDPGLLPLAMRTLLGHALDRTPAGRTVEVQSTEEHGQGVIRFLDRGPDLSAQDLHAMFEPFDSRDVMHHKSDGCHSLDLALAREIVERLGGGLDAFSRPGGGACFAVRLPVAEAARLTHGPA